MGVEKEIPVSGGMGESSEEGDSSFSLRFLTERA
jgi:hypothetical protein